MPKLYFRADERLDETVEEYADQEHGGNKAAALKHLVDRGLLRKGYGDGAKNIATPLSESARLLAQGFLAVSLGLLLIQVMTPFGVFYGVLGFVFCGTVCAVVWNHEPAITHWYQQRQRDTPVATDGGGE